MAWLTKVNFHLGVVGKLPAASLAVDDGAALLELDELQAAINAEAAAVALNRRAPSSRPGRQRLVLHVQGLNRFVDYRVDLFLI